MKHGTTAYILNASCLVEKTSQRRRIETCPDILALVKNAVAEPSLVIIILEVPSLLQTFRKICQRANTTTTMDLSAVHQKL